MAFLGMADLATYSRFLENTPAEGVALLELLTVNETSFFRNPAQFRYLTEKIIPELEATRGKQVIRSWGKAEPVPANSFMKLRILCAGCSTGEEPYSVAMSLYETLRYPKAWDLEILACDLNESCIRSASAGYFESEKLKRLPADYREKYLEPSGGGASVREEIRKLIRFSCLNLVDVMTGGNLPGMAGTTGLFDIIFCRNVMIYFSFACQQQLIDSLFRLLVPGGYLFTGDAEPLHMYAHEFEPVRDAVCLIYKKMEIRHDV
jgi:chemotaxis protein methyltransferase CheR